MIAGLVFAVALLVAVLVELVLPGRVIYHYGWYNVGLAALLAGALLQTRTIARLLQTPRAQIAVVAAAFGLAAVGLAGIASGLLAPDTNDIVGAPGESVRMNELGASLVFPLAHGSSDAEGGVMLASGSNASPIGARSLHGVFLLQSIPRRVATVAAFDKRGGHLTITQPNGQAFLSPVLLFSQTQTIAGIALPFDAFAVPAAHRNVKAVLFGPEEAAKLPMLAGQRSGVLFDVQDENDRSVSHGITLAANGQTVDAGGVELRPSVFDYPAVRVTAVPDVRFTIAGALIFAIAAVAAARFRTPSYS